ncbi:MAG: hypothetical protein OM95_10050 [Bdellovibrio sp. ArHS]|uniref:hypothetical protein n=1 Tax=Bdellovibrio sp. ArHS TaxID=1569284 RepID=UPI000582BE92|nr:hypothetical protein [Bdellovibrio sp. ArHS]KHD88239.1 MAG: hypothetical protein OM95_10050 [Bdellovibrio sp. ArHS]
MITTQTARLLVMALLSTSLLAACSKGGFETLATDGNSSQGSSGDNSGQDTPPPSVPSQFDKLDMNAYVGSGTYENEQVVALDKANNALLLYLPLPPGPFSSVYIDVPSAKGVKIQTVLDSQQKARVAVSIPLRLIVKDKVTLPPATTLPGGRALPMMPSGEYPSLALGLNQNSDNKIYLYMGVNAVGLFVESSFFPEYVGITAPIKNQAQTRTLGYFTIVPKQGSNKGGLFLSFLLPNDLAAIIDDHLSGIIN